MNTLQTALNQIAQEFTTKIAAVISAASFQDVAGLTGNVPAKEHSVPRGRPARRVGSSDNITTARVAAYIAKEPAGIRAETIREHFGVDKAAVVKVMKKALAENLIHKTGNKRATTYFAVAAQPAAPEAEITNPSAVLSAATTAIEKARSIVKKSKKGATVVVMPENKSG